MKKAFVLCALVGVAVYATTAWSASKADPTVSRLVKDVASLKKQVAALQKQQKSTSKELTTVGDVAVGGFLYTVCSDEVAADAFQGTWNVIDQIAVAQTESPGKSYFGQQTAVTATIQGQDICQTGGVTRSQVVPPTVAPYLALFTGLHTSSYREALNLFASKLHTR
jgi:hypothetical protein